MAHFITYADNNYETQKEKLISVANSSEQFDSVTGYTRYDLIKSEFYLPNKSILDDKKYAGWCLWKPIFILKKLIEIPENDILVYIDCGDMIVNQSGINDFLIQRMKNIDILLTRGAYPNYAYTKRDAFILMQCDDPSYWNDIQVEAGIIVCKNTPVMNRLLIKWLKLCCDRRIITDDLNVCGYPNLPGFIEGRADQSILSILAKRYEIARTDEMRKFITCNVNDRPN